MATNDKTIDRLQYLEILYRQGYRSDVIDRSLDKIIALDRAGQQRDLADLQERLQACETHYQMPSEEFYRRFRAGELGDAMDVVQWSGKGDSCPLCGGKKQPGTTTFTAEPSSGVVVIRHVPATICSQ